MESKPIWKKDKFWYVVLGVVGVLAIALGGTALGLDDEMRRKAMEAILWLVGLLIGAHTVTDSGSQFAGAMKAKAEADARRAQAEMVRATNGTSSTRAHPTDGGDGEDGNEGEQ